MNLTNMKKRSIVLFGIFVALFLFLAGKTAYWQIVRGDELKTAAIEQQTGETTITASRGNIYDRNGKVLAESGSVNTLVCNPQNVEEDGDAEYAAEKLAEVLNMPEEDILALLQKGNRYQVIKKRLSVEESEAVKALKTPKDADGNGKADEDDTSDKFTGIYFEEDSKRYYSYGIAPQVIGFTGYDNNGLQGIELEFDEYLSGKAGAVSEGQTAGGTTLGENDEFEYLSSPQKGADVILTIDETLQQILEKYLESAVSEYELKEGAAGIMMNPNTGEVLAMATVPDYDLNDPSSVEKIKSQIQAFDYTVLAEEPESENPTEAEQEAYEREVEDLELYGQEMQTMDRQLEEALNAERRKEDPDFDEQQFREEFINDYKIKNRAFFSSLSISEDEIEERETAYLRNKMWRNKAISDTYEPGSVFKIITAAAALEEGVVSLDNMFTCTGSKKVGDRDIGCHNRSGHGTQTFAEGVKHSCNPVFMETGLRLGSDKFMEYFTAFGLTQRTGIDLVGEASSIYYHTKMSNVDIATSSFGQGFQVTPLQLITAVSAVINGGDLMKPQIVKEIRNDSGIVKSFQPEVVNTVISEETSAIMRELLESVVSASDGSGKNAYVKGYRIGGKTGTSEKNPRGSDKRIASFLGFAPADDPQIVCLVMLDEPQVANKYGGTLAAPLVGSIMEESLEYLGVEKVYREGEEPDVLLEVPDLRGLGIEDAKDKAEEAGFSCRVEDDGVDVVSQLPKPGITLQESSSIILYTEEAEDDTTVTVPDVSGMSIEQARNAITRLGLNFEIVGAGRADSSGAYAYKQSIAAGSKVSPSTVIGVEFRHTSTD